MEVILILSSEEEKFLEEFMKKMKLDSQLSTAYTIVDKEFLKKNSGIIKYFIRNNILSSYNSTWIRTGHFKFTWLPMGVSLAKEYGTIIAENN